MGPNVVQIHSIEWRFIFLHPNVVRRELEALKDACIPAAGNSKYRFHYFFLNVVDNPAARQKPSHLTGTYGAIGAASKRASCQLVNTIFST